MISAKLARAWGVQNEVYVPRKPPKKFRGNPAWFLFVPDFQSLKSKKFIEYSVGVQKARNLGWKVTK